MSPARHDDVIIIGRGRRRQLMHRFGADRQAHPAARGGTYVPRAREKIDILTGAWSKTDHLRERLA